MSRRPRNFGGAPNMRNMRKQMQKLQKQMEEAQSKLDATEVEASAGGGMVKLTMNGKKEVTSVTIDPEILDPEEADMVQDMVMVAVNDAVKQIDDLADEAAGKFSGGLNIPGL